MKQKNGLVKKIKNAIAIGAFGLTIAGMTLYSVRGVERHMDDPARSYHKSLTAEEEDQLRREGMEANDEYQASAAQMREEKRQTEKQYESDRINAFSGYIVGSNGIIVPMEEAPKEDLESKLLLIEDLSDDIKGLEETSEDAKYFHKSLAKAYEKIMSDFKMAQKHYQLAGMGDEAKRMSELLKKKYD